MRLRKLKIQNFRGIKNLEWELPDDPRLFALIGPGDSGKSTILKAIEYLLGDRWNIPFSDSDFFMANVDNEILIQAYLIDIPKELLKDSALGLYLCGTTKEHQFNDDPATGFDPSLAVQLKVNGSLEPEWSILKNREEYKLSASKRRKFGVFSVDPRSETQLRWSRTSALGRLSAGSNADRSVLAEANRAAQQAIASGENKELSALTNRIQEEINSIGSGQFDELGVGLDTYLNSMGAGLALYEGNLPLSSYGLGTKRLASLAVQQLSVGHRSVALLDELEMGLEPHRSISLIHNLRQDDRYAQVFVTTHSPIVVEQVDISSLTVVRNDNGAVIIKTIGESSDRFAKIRRGRPSSLLARRILLCEGKTEYGIIKKLVESWDRERFSKKKPVSASLGFTHSDADGGSEVALRAIELHNMGYEVAGFMDNDVRDTDEHVKDAEREGVRIFRWREPLNTETQICSSLDYSLLEKFAKNHASKTRYLNSALKDLKEAWGTGSEEHLESLLAEDWKEKSVDIEKLRTAMGNAAHKHGWYKTIDKAEKLGAFLLENQEDAALSETWALLNQVKSFIYGAEGGSCE